LDRLHWQADPSPVLDLLHRLRAELRAGIPLRVEDLALNGRDLIALGLKPGPRFGEILEDLMDRVLQDPSLNTRDRLEELVESAGYLSEGRQ
jgi:tRNA nucleotidyltransferase (CCA-adding enzyme)